MSFVPRLWQQKCFDDFQQKLKDGGTSFIFEACMGAGKSAMAAWMAKALVGPEWNVDLVLALVPWKSIQGDVDRGMLATFGEMGLDARDHLFTAKRRLARQPRPGQKAIVTLYHEVCNREALETLMMWQADGLEFALICDEIHHTNEIDSRWGNCVEQFQKLAAYSVFMSGTFFRTDNRPISCIPLAPNKDGLMCPVKDYQYTYKDGVRDDVVRAVTTRDIDANVELYDSREDRNYQIALKDIDIPSKEFDEAKKQVLDPQGKFIGGMIETVHKDLLKTRTKFHDAACLFICRPGSGGNFTRDDGESNEDRHVEVIAERIKELTGETPTVVTHHDPNSAGKIAGFRRGSSPYLVAVNMVSEGCDIPRLRAVAFCRHTTSQMLFRQIVGRALRLHKPEDGTAAQIYIPAFQNMVDFAKSLYDEAQEGIVDRTCQDCGEWPCVCVCKKCGKKKPCACVRVFPPCPVCGSSKRPCECQGLYPPLVGIDATPVLFGGHVGADHVEEDLVQIATQIGQEHPAHAHGNPVQDGHKILLALKLLGNQRSRPSLPETNPGKERASMRGKGRKIVRQLANAIYRSAPEKYQEAFRQEIEVPFGAKFAVIFDTWSFDKLHQVIERLERRIVEVFRRG